MTPSHSSVSTADRPNDLVQPGERLAAPSSGLAVTSGTLLSGRIAYTQFRDGNRTGIEPVLMAALVPARPGQRVIEAGCGAGAGLLCLTQRVPALLGVGVEADLPTAQLAQDNMSSNQRTALSILHADILDPHLSERLRISADSTTEQETRGSFVPFDHAFANPPWHRTNSTASPDLRRDKARRAKPDTIHQWVRALARVIRDKGSLTLALPAEQLANALAAFETNGIGSAEIVPLWPEAGKEARLVLVRGRLRGRAGSRLLAGLTLHGSGGAFTDEAEAILRGGSGLLQRPGLSGVQTLSEP